MQTERLLSGVNKPSDATYIQTLCLEKKFKKNLERALVAQLVHRMAEEVYDAEFEEYNPMDAIIGTAERDSEDFRSDLEGARAEVEDAGDR